MKPPSTQLEVDIDIATEVAPLPESAEFIRWIQAALATVDYHPEQPDRAIELAIRIVDEAESQQINRDYRQQDKPTNILSFPAELPEGIPVQLLGDLLYCAPVIAREAVEQDKPLPAHWAHLTVHGVLHLLGYDHIEEDDARIMETLEVNTLAALGFADPYVIDNNQKEAPIATS